MFFKIFQQAFKLLANIRPVILAFSDGQMIQDHNVFLIGKDAAVDQIVAQVLDKIFF